MNENEVLSILERIPWIGHIGTSGEWHYTVRCLMSHRHEKGYDRHPSMTVSYDVPTSWVECFSCGYRAPLEKTLYTLARMDKIDPALPLDVTALQRGLLELEAPGTRENLVEDYSIPLKHLIKNTFPKEAIQLLNAKGITLETAKKYKLAYAPAGHSDEWMGENKAGEPQTVKNAGIVLPVFTKYRNKWVCAGAQMRFLEGNLKYFSLYKFKASRRLFNEPILYGSRDKHLFLVEGPFDALHLCQIGVRAVALLGTKLNTHKAELIKSVDPKMVHILLDNDVAGQAGSQKAETILKTYGIPYCSHKAYKDPKEYTKSEIDNLINTQLQL